ncbi:MAG: lysogenization regulator HflD [Candidatus Portiera sp.]|nr:lysogenization regulator HflD [Portiera sp.]
MDYSESNNVLALAAAMQAVSLVDYIAFTGKVKHKESFKGSINSLITPNKDSVYQTYTSLEYLKLGVVELYDYCKPEEGEEPRLENKMKYLNQLNYLSKMVNKDSSLAQDIAMALSPDKTANHKKSTSALTKYLAQIYFDNFSSLPTKKRIIVVGKQEYLRESKNIDMIRALLFAGIRAMLLWRMYDGNMLLLFTRRKKMFRELGDIMRKTRYPSANA